MQTPLTVKMGSKLIDIPAGARDHVVTDTYELPVAVDLMSVYAHAHVNLGTLLFSRGRLKEALPHFERAVALKPNSAVIHSNLGSALAASGRYADALRAFQRALALNPQYGPALENVQRLQQMGIR